MLESSPALLERLKDASQSEIDLTGEIAVARTLLEEVLGLFARKHSTTGGQIDPSSYSLITSQLTQVQRIVRDAADIESKRTDQRLSATHVLMLLGRLRDELNRALTAAFGGRAADVVGDVFGRQKWTGSLDDEKVREALAEPQSYDVAFRLIDREGEQVVERAKEMGMSDLEAEVLASPDGEDEDEEEEPCEPSPGESSERSP